jgi:glycosyltransferase involved in cell wall biosynthesis
MSEIITLAICTYNNCSLLNKTLATIEKQCVDASIMWSTLVIDNNSTDGTQQLVQTYIQSNRIPGLHYVLETQQGLAYARRRAVAETKSELIAFIDDDCLLSPDWVEQAVAFCRNHPMAGAVGGRVELLWETPPDEFLLQCKDSLSAQDYGDLPTQLPSTGWTYLVGAGLLLRRKALESSGWIDSADLVDRCGSKLTSGGDIEIVLRIRKAGYQLWYNPAMQLQHYIPQRRMSVEYLCNLHRGFGQGDHILHLLAYDEKPTLAWRFRRIFISVHSLIRQLLGILVREIMRGKKISPVRLLLVQRALGNIEGSYHFMGQEYQK